MKNIYISSMKDEENSMLKLAKKYNLGFEVLNFIEPYLINDITKEAKNLAKEIYSIEHRALHGPFIDLFPASKDPEVVRVAKDRFLEAYEVARTINAKHIIFHAGFIPKAHSSESWLCNSIKFWNDFLSVVGKDIEIHIENVSADDYVIIKDLIESVDNPIFTACLDIGHVNVNSSKSLEDWIEALSNNIKYVHLHNNDGIIDSHYGLHKGEINIIETLELLENYSPDAIWTLETRPNETEESILWLEKNKFVKV